MSPDDTLIVLVDCSATTGTDRNGGGEYAESSGFGSNDRRTSMRENLKVENRWILSSEATPLNLDMVQGERLCTYKRSLEACPQLHCFWAQS